jgi:hypothetical protein
MEKTMNIKTLLLAVCAAAVLASTGSALADPYMRHDRVVAAAHDRYWRPEFRQGRYVERDRVFVELRHRGYARFVGDPYWFQGRYVVKTYNRWGNLVFVEVNPYSGLFIGEVRF